MAARTTVPHIRVVFGGYLGDSNQEIWSCTIKLVSDSGGTGGALAPIEALTAADLTAAAVAYQADLQTFHGGVSHTHCQLNYVKVNAFGANDLQITDPTVDHQFTNYGGSGSSSLPWSSALVLEHRTAGRSRGFASHGRISYPAAYVVNGATGKITTTVGLTTLSQTETAYATLLEALHAHSPSGAFEPAIVYTSTNPAKPPMSAPVTFVIASDIPGEIRRRQNKLTQGSSSTPITGT